MISTDGGPGHTVAGPRGFATFCRTPITGYVSLGGAAGGASCPAGVANLSDAVSVGEWALHVNNYENSDRACTSPSTAMPGAPKPGPPSETGYCKSYDCSSLSTWIARQIPGFNDFAGSYPGITSTWYGCTMGPPTTGLQPCDPAVNPVCWAFAHWGSSSLSGCPHGPGHMYTNICGKIYNACGNSCTPEIKNTASNADARWFIPPGLESLTMDSCAAECTNSTTPGGCNTSSGPVSPSTPLPATPPGGGPTSSACGGPGSGGQDYAPGAFITYGGIPKSGGTGTGDASTPECTELYEQQGATESSNNYAAENSVGCVGRFQHCPFGNLNTDCPRYFGMPNNRACAERWKTEPNTQDIAQREFYRDKWADLSSNPAACAQINSPRVSTNKHISFYLSQSAILSGYNYTPAWVEAYVANGRDRCDYASSNGGMCLSDYMAKHAYSVVIDDPWGIDNPNCHGLKKADGSSPGGGGGGPGGGGCPVNPPCGAPVLTGHFAHNPCDLPPPPEPPGKAFDDFLKEWWEKNFLPAIKNMTTQLYAFRVFETWEMGRMMDAIDVTRAARLEKDQRFISHQSAYPNEAVCVAGSFPHAITQATVTGTALNQGIRQDLTRRSNNVKEAAPYVDPDINPTTERKKRWDEYCQEFYDPLINGASGICPNPTTPGPLMNGDVSIEGMLLKDTIDMSDPHQYKAALALIKNLVRPDVDARVHDSVVLTPQGQERLIRQQHLEAIYAMTTEVVSSIISRRTSMPSTSADIGQLISEIRQKAGISVCDPANPYVICASEKPSYNEIMLAMTKERFFDPQYFYRMQNNIGSLKQEQASIDAYTTVVLQDIYLLQEQINAILAARASMKLDTDNATNQSRAAPLKTPTGP